MARTSKIAGAGVAFVLLIAWMVPPTTPKPPAEATWRSAAKAQQGSATQHAEAPGAPASVYQSYHPDVATVAAYSGAKPIDRSPSLPRLPTDGGATSSADDDLSMPVEPTRTAVANVAPVRVLRPPAPVVRTYDRDEQERNDATRYRFGYTWASANDVQDARECRRWRGDAGEDGCIDYLREQDERADRAEDDRW